MNSGKTSLAKMLLDVRDDPSVRRAFFVFSLTRVLLLAIFIIGGQMDRVSSGSTDTIRDLSLSLGKIPVSRVLQRTVSTADINWYYSAAHDGYEKVPFNTDRPHMVLFPIYFVLAKAGNRPHVDEAIRTVSIALLILMTALFLTHFSLAMSQRKGLRTQNSGVRTLKSDSCVLTPALSPATDHWPLPSDS